MARKEKTMVTDYKGVTIGTYMNEILPVVKEGADDPLSMQVSLIAILNGMTEDEVLNLPVPTYTQYAAALKFLECPCDSSRAGRIASRYTLGELTLIPCKGFETMTAAQFIDFQNLTKDIEKNTIPLLSVFLVPKGHAYNDGYDIREVQEAIADHLSVQDSMEVLAFFFARSMKLLSDSLTFSEQAVRRIKDKEARKDLERRLKEAKEMISNLAGDGSQT